MTAAVPSSPLSASEFRHAVGRFATGVTVVGTVDDDVRYGMTVNSFTSVSLDPLLVLFCCEKISRFHPAVLSSGRWAVSVLGVEQADASQWFATRGRPFEGQFDGWPHHRGTASGALVLDEAIGVVECVTVASYDGGDHTIVLGEVVAVSEPRGGGEPLLYYEGTYHRMG